MGYVIKLGAAGDLKEYTLKQQGEGIAWSRGPANPFAATVNTSSPYDKVDTWNELNNEDWQAGVGRVNPEDGGFLYAEAETRVPNQVILPQAPVICSMLRPANDYSNWAYSPGQATSLSTYSLGDDYLAINVDAINNGTLAVTGVWLYLEAATGTVVRVDVYSDSGGNPNTSLGNASTTITQDFPGPHWYKFEVSASLSPSTDDYWIVVRTTTGTATLYGSTTNPSMSVKTSNNGSTWSNNSFRPFFNVIVTFDSAGESSSPGVPLFIVRGVYSTANNDVIFVGPSLWTSGTYASLFFLNDANYLTKSTFALATPTDAAVFANKVIVALGDSVDMYSFALNGTGSTGVTDVKADLLLSFGGFLYRSLGNVVYYTGSSTLASNTWSDAFQVCPTPYKIRGMAGLEGSLYMGCDDGLYRLAPGDVVEGITPWPISSTNGRGMCSFQGALYIPVNGRVWRYGLDGSLQDVWIKRDDDLPANRLGEVVYLTTTDLHLVALVEEANEGGRSSIWAFQDEGWHHIATLPTDKGNVLYYDRINGRLFAGTNNGQVFYIKLPRYALNPYNNSDSIYMPVGWLQQDRYYGGQYLLNKDFESVTIIGDNLSTNINVKVYWQDENSTDWELLGTATDDGHELRWSDHSKRPQGKWVKLGVLLQTNDPDETPRIRAIVLKFLPMINDRIRDTVTLSLGKVQGPDGDRDTRTLAEQLADIQEDISSVIPRIYEDPLGVQYEVRVIDYSMTIPVFAHEGGSNVAKEMDITMVIEQVPDGTFSP